MSAPLPRRRRTAPATLLATLLLGPVAGPATAADPFYLDRLRDGTRAFAQGDHAGAARDLRIACFGLLDEPILLAEGLIYLGLAQARAGDAEGFLETFRRIVEVEERFGAYSRAGVPAGLRAELEEELVRRVPEAELAASPAFGHLADRKLEAAMARLPEARRRQELQQRIVDEPARELWRVLLAEMELEAGRPEEAAALLTPVLEAGSDHRRALCLRGRARARMGLCPEALPDLEACPAAADPAAAADHLACLAAAERWREARELLAALPEAARLDPAVAPLAQRVAEHAAASPGPAAAPSDGLLSAAERAKMTRARTLLTEAEKASELEAALALAREVADRNPDSGPAQFLAAEIAYRAARWEEAARYFRRGGDPGEERPVLLFYMAVSLYESGDRRGAAAALKRCLPNLQRTPYVDAYIAKILGTP